MSDFSLYFQLGLEHIADLAAYDHMLFIIALCAIFKIADWKQVLILITAFTLGHSITLIFSVLDWVNIDKDLVETLIPITILITCILNLIIVFLRKTWPLLKLHYTLAFFFGLIHGLGFANYLKSLLMGMGNVTVPLLAFNIGIEIGQVAIVLLYFVIYFILIKLTTFSHRIWTVSISILVAIFSIFLIFS